MLSSGRKGRRPHPPARRRELLGRFRVSRNGWIALALVATGAAVYGRAAGFDFIGYDDAKYILDNPAVRGGLTAEGVRWAFTATWAANWHPLTWLSHMLDVTLFGLDAGMHHLTSVAIHLASAVLLFHALRRMTAAPLRSALVAALFCLHPLRAESVLWVAERKDVLSGFFFCLALLAHLRLAERPVPSRRLALAAAAALGLLSKPMLVTLPFVLLLLDFWPLGRPDPALAADPARRALPPVPVRTLLLEKAPLLALSVASSAVTWIAQSGGGATRAIPASFRAANAVVSYAAYLGKAAWPAGLTVFYPHPMDAIPAWKVAASAALLAAVTAGALARTRRSPYLAVGWFWYLGMLVPVIGLVQVGNQAMADRYTYLPLVGVFAAFAWGMGELAERRRVPPRALAAAAAVLLLALSVRTWHQAGYWRDSTSLFTHALEVTGDNWVGRHVLGEKALEEGRYEEAVGHFRAVLRVEPFSVEARNNLGAALMKAGRLDEAVSWLLETERMFPDVPGVRHNLGLALRRQGRLDEAAERFREVLRLSPGDRAARFQLAWIEARRGKAPPPGDRGSQPGPAVVE